MENVFNNVLLGLQSVVDAPIHGVLGEKVVIADCPGLPRAVDPLARLLEFSKAMTDAVENGSTAETFLQDSVDAFMVVPGLLEVIVVFGFVSVLIGLLWFAMSRMGLGQRMGGGL